MDEETDVLEQNGESQSQAPDSGNQPGGAKTKNDTISLTRKEYDALQQSIREANENAKFWAERGKQTPAPVAEPSKPEPEPELSEADIKAILGEGYSGDETPQQLVDDLSEKGLGALKKRGVVTGEQALRLVRKAMEVADAKADRRIRETVQREIGAAREGLNDDAQIIRDFPDLADHDSELFQRASAIFKKRADRDPSLKSDSKHTREALRDAAELATTQLENEALRTGKGRKGDQDEDQEDETVEEFADARTRRIRAQSGSRPGSRGTQPLDEGKRGLSPVAKRILDKFNSDGDGETISEDDYRKYDNYDIPRVTRRGGRK